MREEEYQAWLASLPKEDEIEVVESKVRLRIKEVAQQKGISMGKLHRAADVSYKTIKRIYADPFYPTTTTTLGKLAGVLRVPPGELIEETL